MRASGVRSTRPRYSLVEETPPGEPGEAESHFRSKLALETDPADLFADLRKGVEGFVIVDTRTEEGFREGHIPGAVNLPHRAITESSTRSLPRDGLFVTYCWGPGCNASTKGAARLAALGFRVKELIGGIEYWQREGYPLESG